MFGQTYGDHPLRIRCAKCDKPCERIEWLSMPDCSYSIRVWCHGDRDEMEITQDLIHEMMRTRGPDGLPEGIAFQTDRLTHG